MPSTNEVKEKVQRLLSSEFGSVRIDKDGDIVITYNSAVVFVRVTDGVGSADTTVQFTCPMVTNVPKNNEVYRWVATEGQMFKLGSTVVWERDDSLSIAFTYAVVGDDLDPSELLNSLAAVVITSDRLDNELQRRFGGELFGED